MRLKVVVCICVLIVVLAVKAQYNVNKAKVIADKIGCDVVMGKDTDYVQCGTKVHSIKEFIVYKEEHHVR